MNFQDLYVFTHVARHGGYGRAAAHLRIAQSAISRRISRLQYDLGVELFERAGRGVRLTAEGELLSDRAEGLMRELMLIERELRDRASEPTGIVRLAFPPTIGQMIAPMVAIETARDYPKIELQFREGHLGSIHQWLFEGELDLSVLYDPQKSPELEIKPLIAEPLFVIAPNTPDMARLLPDAPVPLDALGTLPLILPRPSHSIRLYLDRLAAEHKLALNIVYEVEGMQMTKSLVKAGLGCTVFSRSTVHDDIKAGLVRVIPIAPAISWQLDLVKHLGMRPSTGVEAVARLIEKQVETLRRSGVFVGTEPD